MNQIRPVGAKLSRGSRCCCQEEQARRVSAESHASGSAVVALGGNSEGLFVITHIEVPLNTFGRYLQNCQLRECIENALRKRRDGVVGEPPLRAFENGIRAGYVQGGQGGHRRQMALHLVSQVDVRGSYIR